MLFLLALALIAVLVLLQRIAVWLLLRLGRKKKLPTAATISGRELRESSEIMPRQRRPWPR